MFLLKRAAVVLTAVVLVAAVGTGVAGAKKKHKRKHPSWGSQITVTHPSDNEFDGVVSSKFGPCRDSRVVTLFYTDSLTAQTQPVSVQRTTAKGDYQVVLPQPAYGGSYHAEVAQQNVRIKKVTNTCRAASSGSIIVQGPPLTP
jgi:hypothetical protein